MVFLVLTRAACAPQRTVVFACPEIGDVTVRHGSDEAIVTIAGGDMRLPRAIAASGARYERDGTQVWEHQGEATVDFGGRHYAGCKPR